MGNRGTWNQSGRKRVGADKRSWLGRTKNKVGNFFFGARGKTNNQRKYLGRVKNYVEAGLKKIPFVGRRVTRSRNNRQAAPSSGSWWWPWGSRKPNKPSLTSYNIVPVNTVIPAKLAKLGNESNANLNSIAQLQNQQKLERIQAATAAAAGVAAAQDAPKAKSLKAAAVAGAEAVISLSPNPSALQTLAGAQAGIKAAVQNNPSFKPGNLSSRMQSATTLKPLLKPKSSTGKGLTSSQRSSAITAGRLAGKRVLTAASIQRAAAAGTRSLPPRSSPRAFGQAAAAATLASIPNRLRILPRYVEKLMPELFGTRKSTKSPLLLLKNKPKSPAENAQLRKLIPYMAATQAHTGTQSDILKALLAANQGAAAATPKWIKKGNAVQNEINLEKMLRNANPTSPAAVGQSRKNRKGPLRKLLSLQPQLNRIRRKLIPYMAATQAHTGTQSDRLKALLAANQGAGADTPRWIEKGNAVDKEIRENRLEKMLEKAHPTSPVGSPKTPKSGASTEKPSKRQSHGFGKW